MPSFIFFFYFFFYFLEISVFFVVVVSVLELKFWPLVARETTQSETDSEVLFSLSHSLKSFFFRPWWHFVSK
jgi:hypothetical protein